MLSCRMSSSAKQFQLLVVLNHKQQIMVGSMTYRGSLPICLCVEMIIIRALKQARLLWLEDVDACHFPAWLGPLLVL
jgi:hypothetical protein